MATSIVFEQGGGIARLGLNRVEQHNALGRMELAAIERALEQLADDTRVLVIQSEAGRTFCAGADLTQIASGELSGDQFQAMTNRVAELPIPTICVVNGNVFGGGVEFAMSCDFRIAADDIMMRIPAAAIGLCYPIDGIERLAARLGAQTAKRILVAAEELSASDMAALGIVDRIASPAEVVDVGMANARRLARQAPLATQAMLAILKQAERGDINKVAAAQMAERCANSNDLQEGLAARRERRKPTFSGR